MEAELPSFPRWQKKKKGEEGKLFSEKTIFLVFFSPSSVSPPVFPVAQNSVASLADRLPHYLSLREKKNIVSQIALKKVNKCAIKSKLGRIWPFINQGPIVFIVLRLSGPWQPCPTPQKTFFLLFAHISPFLFLEGGEERAPFNCLLAFGKNPFLGRTGWLLRKS